SRNSDQRLVQWARPPSVLESTCGTCPCPKLFRARRARHRFQPIGETIAPTDCAWKFSWEREREKKKRQRDCKTAAALTTAFGAGKQSWQQGKQLLALVIAAVIERGQGAVYIFLCEAVSK